MMDRQIPFRIGSDVLPGLSKFIEETGEANTIVGKAMGLGTLGRHWDGQELKIELEKELADVMASVSFLIAHNQLDEKAITDRADWKFIRFCQWHENIQDGRDPNHGVVYDDDHPVEADAQ